MRNINLDSDDIEIIDWGDQEEEKAIEILPDKKKVKKKKVQEEEPLDMKKEIISWIKVFLFAIVAAFIIDYLLIVNAEVPSGSMENTIMTHSNMIGFRWSYTFDNPERGDIIIFKYPDNPKKNYVKRVIGVPGDEVRITSGKVYINGKKIKEDYVVFKDKEGNKCEPNESGNFPANNTVGAIMDENGNLVVEVPENSYFVLGDNRNNSNDSRFWTTTNYVPKENIMGKAILCYWHKGPKFEMLK